MTQLQTKDVQSILRGLGYYDGPIDGDYQSSNYRDDLKRFQRDYKLTADGWYGTKTEAALMPVAKKLQTSPIGGISTERQCRRWQLTSYWVGDVTAWNGPLVPMKTPGGAQLARVPANAFAEAALEGATKLADGRLVGVAHPAYSACDSNVFRPVYEVAKRNGWVPSKPGYAGIQLSSDGLRAVSSRNFDLRKTGPKGWPIEAKGIECDPFRTVAADNGLLPKHDPAFKGKGGVVPAGTRVWILELVGMKLPDQSIHDGWCVVNDTGGGIYGAHFDLFVGVKRFATSTRIPSRIHVWWQGCEERVPMSYSYGL